ncbi:helix-turn-helix transcriptional regulator [Pseudoalteromonas rubra]|uniref:helix-turn-helix transcriptional regulator n=1 Tax=Pseudoalteromonas rubra TaxID=43658 RepID=UPI0020178181|nr:YafY family protein [Pseudoalteromonas rubra]
MPGLRPGLSLEITLHKSERLFQLVNLLKSRRLAITAKQLAERLNVSERTIYRDIQHLQSSGVPIEGEAGIGYLIAQCDLPPMMFTVAELQSLLLGTRMASAWTDPVLSEHASSAMAKIEAALPEHLKQQIDDFPYVAASFGHTEDHQRFSSTLREAVVQKRQVRLQYKDAKDAFSERDIEPLGLVYWGGKWTIIGHCLLRNDYREFRLDRVCDITLLTQPFVLTQHKNMQHYIALVKAKYQEQSDESNP